MREIITRVFVYGLAVGLMSCAGAPPVCDVSPIEIEEIISDTKDLDVQLADSQERLAVVQGELAEWEAKKAEREAKVPELRAELSKLKKMSGRKEDKEQRRRTTLSDLDKDDPTNVELKLPGQD